MLLFDEMMAHATEASPNECCGLVLASGKRHRLVRARNLAEEPTIRFTLDPDAWLEVADHEEVIGVYHSHVGTTAAPSMADRTNCELSGLPWHIVSFPLGDYASLVPEGYRAPYLQRPYVYTIHDCYNIVRDWFNWEWSIQLPDFQREEQWWNKGGNLFLDNFEGCGFVQLHDVEAEIGDLFLIQSSSPVPNHAAVFIGEGRILHHIEGRLSSMDHWGGFWAKHSTHHLRHNSRMGIQRG